MKKDFWNMNCIYLLWSNVTYHVPKNKHLLGTASFQKTQSNKKNVMAILTDVSENYFQTQQKC
jgi:hypothetical protein